MDSGMCICTIKTKEGKREKKRKRTKRKGEKIQDIVRLQACSLGVNQYLGIANLLSLRDFSAFHP